MHEHKELNHAHVLLYCKTCDVVYCEACKSEWKKPQTTWTYSQPIYNLCGNDHYTVPNDSTGTITVS